MADLNKLHTPLRQTPRQQELAPKGIGLHPINTVEIFHVPELAGKINRFRWVEIWNGVSPDWNGVAAYAAPR